MGTLLVNRRAGAVRRRIYLSGDTFTGKHLDEIRKRHPDSDTAVVHLGGTPTVLERSPRTPITAWTFCNGLRPRLAVPVHYDDYRVFGPPLSEFLSAMKGDSSGQVLKAPARGETVLLDER
jgi:L-ascorbate metabolism protein UlaG (beta-lactamase superfamily)